MKAARLLLLVFLVLSVSCQEGAPEFSEGFLEANGTTLYYKTIGSGEPIVVLHGGPGFDHRQFLPYIAELASRYRVILYDQRGTGLSSGPVDPDSITIDNFIADVEAIREEFGIRRMNLLGHSWGGILAMHYAIRHPGRLRTLTLCSTTATMEAFGPMVETIARNRDPEDKRLLEAIAATEEYRNGDPETFSRFWRIYFRAYFTDPSLADEMDLTFTENTIKNANAVAGLIFESIGEFDLHEDLAVVSSPTLVLHGALDPLPLEYAERIHESIAGSELVVLENSGHWPFVDATEAFRTSVLEFLDGVTGR